MSKGESSKPIEKKVEEFVNNEKQKPHIIKIVDSLAMICNSGNDHLNAWQTTRESISGPLGTLATHYLIRSAIAHISMTVLEASKLLDKSKTNVSIKLLFKCLQRDSHIKEIAADKLKLIEICKGFEQKTMEYQVELNKVLQKRHEDIAHLAPKNIGFFSDDSIKVDIELLRVYFRDVNILLTNIYTLNNSFYPYTNDFVDYQDGSSLLGNIGLQDVLYFVNRSYWEESVVSPNEYVESGRQIEIMMRKSQLDDL